MFFLSGDGQPSRPYPDNVQVTFSKNLNYRGLEYKKTLLKDPLSFEDSMWGEYPGKSNGSLGKKRNPCVIDHTIFLEEH
jgi:hypothetical protein